MLYMRVVIRVLNVISLLMCDTRREIGFVLLESSEMEYFLSMYTKVLDFLGITLFFSIDTLVISSS